MSWRVKTARAGPRECAFQIRAGRASATDGNRKRDYKKAAATQVFDCVVIEDCSPLHAGVRLHSRRTFDRPAHQLPPAAFDERPDRTRDRPSPTRTIRRRSNRSFLEDGARRCRRREREAAAKGRPPCARTQARRRSHALDGPGRKAQAGASPGSDGASAPNIAALGARKIAALKGTAPRRPSIARQDTDSASRGAMSAN